MKKRHFSEPKAGLKANLTVNIALGNSTFSPSQTMKDIKLLESDQRKQPGWWRVWMGNCTSGSWGHLVCSVWRRGDWGDPAASSWWEEDKHHWALLSVTRNKGVPGAVAGEVYIDIRKRFSPFSPQWEVGPWRAGSPGQWAEPPAWQWDYWIVHSALHRKMAFHGPWLCYSGYLLTVELYIKTYLAGQETLAFPATQIEYFTVQCVRTVQQHIVIHAKQICLSSPLRDFSFSFYISR